MEGSIFQTNLFYIIKKTSENKCLLDSTSLLFMAINTKKNNASPTQKRFYYVKKYRRKCNEHNLCSINIKSYNAAVNTVND